MAEISDFVQAERQTNKPSTLVSDVAKRETIVGIVSTNTLRPQQYLSLHPDYWRLEIRTAWF